MIKAIYKTLLFASAILLIFSACKKDDENKIDEKWKTANEAAFEKTTNNPDYKRIDAPSKNGYIMCKILKYGAGKTPIFTDKVKARYTGWFFTDWNNPKTKVIFDTTEKTRVPRIFTVGGDNIDGFLTALQYMKEGDKWEVWMPAELGYGGARKDNSIIPPFTTLVFEIELLEVTR